MRRPRFIATQSGRPTGPLGWLIARIMEHETAAVNDELVDRLELEPHHRVLEIGCGHGRTLARIADLVPEGGVVGLDHSGVMVARARRLNRDRVRNGVVQLRQGDSAGLPDPDGAFDRVLAVHTIYFWEQPAKHLRECRRLLGSGGRLLLAHRPADEDDGTFPADVYRFYDRAAMTRLLVEAGFAPPATWRCAADPGVEAVLAPIATRE